MISPRKSVLITGCSAGGIGSALAETFEERGYHVFATLRTPSKISPRLSAAGNVTILQLDVLSRGLHRRRRRAQTGGRLDVLVNNSGRTQIFPALDTPVDEARELFDLNFWAPLAMVQAFAPLLIEARGCLVNNASISAYIPTPFVGIYGSSKAALAMASNTWQHELAPLGVRTITLITCGVKSKAYDNVDAPRLPANSHYLVIRDYLEGLADGGQMHSDVMDAHRYARDVVRAVHRGVEGEVWAGKSALVARLGCWLFPRSILNMVLDGMMHFSPEIAKVKQDVHSGKKVD
ncbi:uncharacterized protein PG998_005869 [Apiospora kogelbergensis]|uniref:uncharacterized protein n=1 Tax=Apiospora kogelbergensis TaxID=1337665 RepID=UPI00312D0945